MNIKKTHPSMEFIKDRKITNVPYVTKLLAKMGTSRSTSNIYLKIHIKAVHERLKNHKCDLCDKAFSQASSLKTHIIGVHERLKNHKCDICDKAFSLLNNLKIHIKIIHEGLKNKM